MKEPIRRNRLNTKQINLIKIIYKFRFTTSSLLAQYRNTDKDSLNRTLQRLVDQNYLVKQYDKSFRLDRKAARFSLGAEALKFLRNQSGANIKMLHALYNNKRMEEKSIEHCLTTMQVAISLNQAYPDVFYIHSASEIAGDHEFPKPRPNLYLNRIEPMDDKANEYFVELHHDDPPYLIRDRFKRILEHFDDEGCPEPNYPTLLFVFGTPRQEVAFAHHAREVLDSAGIDDLYILTTTIKAFLDPHSKNIWTDITESKTLLCL